MRRRRAVQPSWIRRDVALRCQVDVAIVKVGVRTIARDRVKLGKIVQAQRAWPIGDGGEIL